MGGLGRLSYREESGLMKGKDVSGCPPEICDGSGRTGAPVEDVTECRQDRARIEHLNAVLRGIRGVNQLIIHEQDPQRLLQQVCEILVQTRGYRATRVVLQGPDGRPESWAASADPDETRAPVAARESALRNGEWPACHGRALADPTGAVVVDPMHECGACPVWPRQGRGRAAAVSLRHEDRPCGLLCVSLPPGQDLDDEERSLLAEVAGDLTFALGKIAVERQRDGYAQIVTDSLEAMALIGADYRFREANPACLRLLSWPEPSLAGRSLAEVLGEDCFRQVVKPLLDRCLLGEQIRTETDRWPTRGEVRVLDVLCSPCPGREGTIQDVALCLRDITRRKRNEEVLHFQKLLLEAQNEASLDGVLVVDEERRILWSSRRFAELIGMPAPVLALASFDAALAFTKDQVVDPQGYLERVQYLCQHREVGGQDEVRFKDGRILAQYSSPILDAGGAHLGRLWLFRDVTEVKRLQASLAQSDRLASMGMLAAGVAHEINNPLTYVLYSLESLGHDLNKLAALWPNGPGAVPAPAGGDDPAASSKRESAIAAALLADMRERIEQALSGTRRIREISSGLGTFSRVEKTAVTPVDLHRPIEHAIIMATNEIKYRARLVKQLDPVPPVRASDGKLAQVFLNLLVNAAHAVGEGNADHNEIRVRTWAEDGQVFASVSDTGKGIAPEHRARIFEPFFTTKGVGVGSGLGLSICKDIVEGFGGEIGFTSEPGHETRFLIRLPADRGQLKAARVTAAASAPTPAVRGRVLVIDDEPYICDMLQRFLGQEHEVVTAESGEAGKAVLLRDDRFDVLFIDVMMAHTSGMELYQWLARRNPALARRAAFLTGGAFTPEAGEFLRLVENPKVSKPFELADLRALVRDMVTAARR